MGGGKCLINKHLHLRQQILLSGYRSLLGFYSRNE